MSKEKAKRYIVVDLFATLQGEGVHAGRAAVFIRFTGCNIWSGYEATRGMNAKEKGGCAAICDTKFTMRDITAQGGKKTSAEIAEQATRVWNTHFGEENKESMMIVLTGGEPTLQVDTELVQALKAAGFFTSIETNGTNKMPKEGRPDWVTVSPKPPSQPVYQHYDEVKVLFPLFNPTDFAHLAEHKYVQPVDDENLAQHYTDCYEFICKNPAWRVSVQMHKVMGLD